MRWKLPRPRAKLMPLLLDALRSPGLSGEQLAAGPRRPIASLSNAHQPQHRPASKASSGVPRNWNLKEQRRTKARVDCAVQASAASQPYFSTCLSQPTLQPIQQECQGPHSTAWNRTKLRAMPGLTEVAKRASEERANVSPAGKGRQPQRKKQKKQRKPLSPEAEIRNLITCAAQHRDPAAALAAYSRAVAEGTTLRPETYNTLLFLCAGGNDWQMPLQAPSRAASPAAAASQPSEDASAEDAAAEQGACVNGRAHTEGRSQTAAGPSTQVPPEELLRRGREILDRLQASGGATEMAYTALARMAAASRDADGALQAAKEAASQGISVRLRMLVPALLAYSASGNADKAFEVEELIRSHDLDLTEADYTALLAACRQGAPYDRVTGLLTRMGRELTRLSEDTLQAAEAYFRTESAAEGLPVGEQGAEQRWLVERCTVDAQGVTSTCGGQLQAVDLDESEFTAFADGIAKLAAEKEKEPNDFKTFQEWLEEHGPYGAIIDGANVALFGQNYEEGGFRFSQIGDVVETLVHAHPELKPLVVLHKRRLKAEPATEEEAQQLIETLNEENMLYASPFGSNDDWYWLYAAVKAGSSALLVSNDEMRDHIFQLLAPKYFLKWKQRHQMRYKFVNEELECYNPAPYTACIQKLSTGSWLLPAAASQEWLCARPVSAARAAE